MMAQTGIAIPHLRAWRIARLMTQDRLAELSSVSHDAISRAENGGQVALATVHKLAGALGIDAQTLVNRAPKR
jgi:transcriptional regulator with XRE-family HTH domain